MALRAIPERRNVIAAIFPLVLEMLWARKMAVKAPGKAKTIVVDIFTKVVAPIKGITMIISTNIIIITNFIVLLPVPISVYKNLNII